MSDDSQILISRLLTHQTLRRDDRLVKRALSDEQFRAEVDQRLLACGMKSLVLLIGLLKSEDGSGGFVFIDEPFAHLDIRNIQLVGEFLKNTEAQYLMTTPLTHNTDVYDPSELTLITSKKKKDTQWAQPIFVLQRRVAEAKVA